MKETRDSVSDVWGERTPHLHHMWPVRADARALEEPERWVQSACVLCSNGCGLDIGVRGGRIVGVRGREVDRVNHGRLGPKGLHGWEANHSPDRLTRPLVRRGGELVETDWEEAMGLVVERTKQVRDRYTSGAVGFYNTGQLFLEEYYTLSMIAHAGLGTNSMDGNTRLCTATASQAYRESFGSDGPPGSFTDFDECDCLLLCGHNMAFTQTVLWMRVLDRRRSDTPPKLVVIDPRETETAREADVHLAPRLGTNVAVMNGLLRLVIEAGHTDDEFVERHTVGFDKLRRTVDRYTPERVETVTGVPAGKLREAAEVIGTSEKLVSTVLQGFYQSHQATAAAVQVNNLNLVRGMIGKPGCTVFQMNGQPTSENTRETGCDGEFPAFRNWHNPAHLYDLAARWNVDPKTIPHWHLPHHAMEIFRHAELGSLKMLWVICTNPAVSLPELHRIRKILSRESLFVVVQDAFLTETARLADVVLPAAIWGEKTGTFTNADRTVHISHKAVEPPGEARPDFDIFLDYARRMEFKDKDGQPLIKWSDPEGAFEHWKECSRGWVCDYSGLSYEKLSGGSGVQWPCNEEHPDGAERLYTDFRFKTSAGECETYGHDIETGAARTPVEYEAHDPGGRAILKAAHYSPPEEEPDDDYPFWLTTGRLVHHWHTRTKTGRSQELQEAAPEVFVEMNEADAEELGIAEGEVVEVASRRGTLRAPARLGGIEPGHVFVPFHYGYWDERGETDEEGGHKRAANELTLTSWDPVSKQPHFKFAAVQVRKTGAEGLTGKLADAAGKLFDRASELADKAMAAAHAERRHVSDYVGRLVEANEQFVEACETVASRHAEDAEMRQGMTKLSEFSYVAAELLRPFEDVYGAKDADEPSDLRSAVLPSAPSGSFGLLRDLHALYVMSAEVHIALTIVMQASKELRDDELLAVCIYLDEQNKRQQAWLVTQIEHRAPHTLVVPQ
ncbi:MAG TPA: nitrate reductase [Pyrinomonadaceae bacterium]|jgi:anaerobic selenocysteine-containing dehydrogenase|nr:nitrate reductase [Pyrinomonadaceae bacterium]